MKMSRTTVLVTLALACACGTAPTAEPFQPESQPEAAAAPRERVQPPAASMQRPEPAAAPSRSASPDSIRTAGSEPTTSPPPDSGSADAGNPAPADSGKAVSEQATTYNEHVQPIFARACVTCHSEGQIAPFSLDTYDSAKRFALVIASVTRSRTMPPSVIDNSGSCNTFRDLPWLSDEEIATIERWATQDAPEGPAVEMASPTPSLPKLSGDLKTIKTPAYVPSTAQSDDWRCFVVESPISANTFVTGYDTRPGDKKTAHHMVVFYPTDDVSAALAQVIDDSEEGPGYTCFGSPSVPATVIAAWAPGGGATLYPEKLGVPVDAGRPIIIQMHYNTVGLKDPSPDTTEIDLQVQSEGVTPGAFVNVLDLEMALQPGQTDAEEVVQTSVTAKIEGRTGPVEVYGIFPHMHELGKTLTLTVDRNGSSQCMLDAPRYSFHWQRMYFFDTPVTIDAADTLSARCVFDTTSRTSVTNWGESTQDEMCVAGMFIKL